MSPEETASGSQGLGRVQRVQPCSHLGLRLPAGRVAVTHTPVEPPSVGPGMAAWLTEATKHSTEVFAGQGPFDLKQPMATLWEGFRKLLCPSLCKPAPPWGSRPTPLRGAQCRCTQWPAGSQPVLPPPDLGWETLHRGATARRSTVERAPGSAFGSEPARPQGEHNGEFHAPAGLDPKAPLPSRSHEWAFHGQEALLFFPT